MNKISYDDAFEALSGLSIGHVYFSSKEYKEYVKDNEDLQRHINKCNDLKAAYVYSLKLSLNNLINLSTSVNSSCLFDATNHIWFAMVCIIIFNY